MVSVPTVLASLPTDTKIGILKIDVEGAEQSILVDQPEWLTRVQNLLIEIHQDRVQVEPLLKTLTQAGLVQVSPPRHQVWEFSRPLLHQSDVSDT